jgi:hypothetical protein
LLLWALLQILSNLPECKRNLVGGLKKLSALGWILAEGKSLI